MEVPTKVKGYDIVNPEKAERAYAGTPDRNGGYKGGVRKPDGTYDDDAFLAEYDRLGGLVRKNGDTVKMGSFYDFANRKPREKAEVYFEFRINGRLTQVKEGEPEPMVVKAARVNAELEKEEREEKAEKKAKKSK